MSKLEKVASLKLCHNFPSEDLHRLLPQSQFEANRSSNCSSESGRPRHCQLPQFIADPLTFAPVCLCTLRRTDSCPWISCLSFLWLGQFKYSTFFKYLPSEAAGKQHVPGLLWLRSPCFVSPSSSIVGSHASEDTAGNNGLFAPLGTPFLFCFFRRLNNNSESGPSSWGLFTRKTQTEPF